MYNGVQAAKKRECIWKEREGTAESRVYDGVPIVEGESGGKHGKGVCVLAVSLSNSVKNMLSDIARTEEDLFYTKYHQFFVNL